MPTKKSELISEGDCPFCGTGYIFNDDDRVKGENHCTTCGKTYKIEKSNNIILKNPAPIVEAKPQRKTFPLISIIMIPLTILLAWFIFDKISTIVETPTDITVTPPLSQIDQCYKNAYDAMMDNWLGYCEINGIKIYKDAEGKDTCNTPQAYAEEANAVYIENKALCLA